QGQPLSTPIPAAPGPANLIRATINGLIAAFAGVFLWNQITLVSGKVYGLAAVGIGLVVGFMVLKGAKEKGLAPAILGAVLAFVSMMAGQYLSWNTLLAKLATEQNMHIVRGIGLHSIFTHIGPMSWLYIALGVYAGFIIPYSGLPNRRLESGRV